MHRFQPVARVRQRTVHNGRERIGQIPLANGAAERLCHIFVLFLELFTAFAHWVGVAEAPNGVKATTGSAGSFSPDSPCGGSDTYDSLPKTAVRGDIMSKFILATFLILGWSFYELSGGADFVPEERVAEVEPVVEAPVEVAEVEPIDLVEDAPVADVVVTRADQSDILNLSTGALLQPAVSVAEEVAPQPEADVVLAAVTDAIEAEVVVEEAPELDIRYVSGARVNMRTGPGTNFAVLDTLDGGTEAEVLEVDSTGWARIRIAETGAIGWMAERLLSES